MKFLFACESYWPSVGGVQEVMRQIAERLVSLGHSVTVLTSHHPQRTVTTHNGVRVKSFAIQGNRVGGLNGETQAFQDYLLQESCDALMIKAAQQWTFDLAVEILPQLSCRKVFIPCGFSGLHWPGYTEYYQQMPTWLNLFDQLIFYAQDYQDTQMALQAGLGYKSTFLPNGADEREFTGLPNQKWRSQRQIPEDCPLFVTVGSLTGLKGHWECLQAFAKSGLKQGHLILNGNGSTRTWAQRLKTPLKAMLKGGHWWAEDPLFFKLWVGLHNLRYPKLKVELCHLPRPELLQLLASADAFLFASRIEYSPLVYFEAAAAGLNVLTADVGNAREIAAWLPHMEILPTSKDHKGESCIDLEALAAAIGQTPFLKPQRQTLAQKAQEIFHSRFAWSHVALEYLRVLQPPKQSDKS